ncbi:MAG: response regulator transcription factor [Bacteroidota bacterium]
MSRKINVLIVDDNQFQNDGLVKLFSDCEDITLRGILQSPEECLERVKKDTLIDIILLDIIFPNSSMNGIQLAYELNETFSTHPIWKGKPRPKMLFMSVKEGGIVDIEKGIHGFISKNIRFDDLVEVIRQVFHHKAVYYPEPIDDSSEKEVGFTPQEKKVFCKVMKGQQTVEIAELLEIKPNTVSEHRKNILGKLKEIEELKGIRNITDPRVTNFANEHGICE